MREEYQLPRSASAGSLHGEVRCAPVTGPARPRLRPKTAVVLDLQNDERLACWRSHRER
jgi:hypothetical protein